MSYLGTGVTQGIVDLDSFAGNGSTAAFTLTRAPSSSESLLVVTDGVVQDPGEWTISGATLTFTTAPHSGADIRVWNLSSSAQDAIDPSSTIETLSGVNGSQLTFTLSNSAASQDQVLVFVDGIMQNDSKYSVDGTALVFGSGNAPPNGSILDVFTITSGGFTATVPGDNTVTLAKMADDAVGVAELSATGTASSSTFLRGDNAWAAAGGGYTEGCRVHATVAQAIPNDAFTDLNFQSERYDTDTMADQTDAGTNIKITFTTAGVYVVWGGFRWTNDGTTSNSISICLNGTTTIAYVRNDPSDGLWMATIATLWTFDAADYVTLQARQETGSPLNTYVPVGGDVSTHQYAPEFAAQRIG